MQTLTFEEFNTLVEPTDYLMSEGDTLFFYKNFDSIQVEGVFSDNKLKSILFADELRDNYYHCGDQEHSAEHYTSVALPNIVEKIEAVKRGEPYPTTVDVELDLDEHQWYDLMKEAHQKDITLNQYVQQILQRVIDNVKDTSSKDT